MRHRQDPQVHRGGRLDREHRGRVGRRPARFQKGPRAILDLLTAMNRRDLLKGLAALPFVAGLANARTPAAAGKLIKPKRLRAGDTVALISPASGLSQDQINKAVENMTSLGLKSKIGKYAAATNGFLAGTDAQRIEDIHWAFSDKSIDAVWCLRGGYGLSRILPQINY